MIVARRALSTSVLLAGDLLIVALGCRAPSVDDSIGVPDDSARVEVVKSPIVAKSDVAKTPDVAVLGVRPLGPTESAVVLRVIDGDTIVVDRGHGEEPLRYVGVDAPETVHPTTPVEIGGAEAAAYNRGLVDGQAIVLEKDVSERDRFGRLLRHVWVRAPESAQLMHVGLSLVRRGHARAIAYPPDVAYEGLLLAAQDEASRGEAGVWAPSAAETSPGSADPIPGPQSSETGDGACHPSYRPCLPIVDDLDCPDVKAMGKAPVEVIGDDDYRLDRDRDAVGCE